MLKLGTFQSVLLALIPDNFNFDFCIDPQSRCNESMADYKCR